MFKSSTLLVLWICLGLSAATASAATDVQVQREQTLTFKLNFETLRAGIVQYFFETSGKIASETEMPSSLKAAFDLLKPIDMRNVWNSRGSQKYAINMNRIAYIVNKPISFFTKETILSPRYLNAVSKGIAFETKEDAEFPGDVIFRASSQHLTYLPSATFRLAYYSHLSPQISEKDRLAISTGARLDGMNRSADVVVLQEGYNFSGVRFAKETSKRAYTVASHYALDKTSTLVVTYNLSYLITVPPMQNHFLHNGMVGATKYYIHNLRLIQ